MIKNENILIRGLKYRQAEILRLQKEIQDIEEIINNS